jgi:hypothetical protein
VDAQRSFLRAAGLDAAATRAKPGEPPADDPEDKS